MADEVHVDRDRRAPLSGSASAGRPSPPLASGQRVAIVHDWLTGMRGGERVLESICRLFPSADLYTLVHVPKSVSPVIERHRIHTSFIQHLPGAARYYRQYLPLFPMAVERLDLDDADVVLSTSHCAVKSVVRPGRAVHICYCHSPMRYAWDQFPAYFGPERIGHVGSALARPVLAWLARWDRDTANRVDRFVANSRYVAARIRRYYNRSATVLYPPVDVDFFTPGTTPPEPYFLVVSALVPYKRIEVAIQAAARLGASLKIVGTGPDLARLRAAAGPSVEFLGSVTRETLRDLYRRTEALILPAEEDFGMAPVEALACGRPVIAFDRGGATETVESGVSGLLVDRQTADSFADAMVHVRRMPVDPERLVARASLFSADRFDAGFRDLVSDTLRAAIAC